MESITVPDRSTSLPNRQERRLTLQTSRQDLKRKLSDSLLEKGSRKHIELCISDIEIEREELALDRDDMNWEAERKMVGKKEHLAGKREINRRIISLGDDLWKLKRKLREIDEKDGVIALLSPDSEGAFVSTLLHLYKDPNSSRKRSTTMQTEMKRSAIKAYDATHPTADLSKLGWLRCAITAEYFPPSLIKAAHIVPASLGTELATYIFGQEKGTRIFSVDNCLILNKEVEQAFDSGNICIMPVDPAATPIRKWKVMLVNESSRNQGIYTKGFSTLGNLDGKELEFHTEQRPAARFLYYHFVLSLLRCRQYNQPGWEAAWTRLKTSRPWPTPGRYLRQSMLMTLAQSVGDIEEEDIEALTKDHTFDCQESLRRDEEQEIARRIEDDYESRIKALEEGEDYDDGEGDGDDRDDGNTK